MIRTVLGGETRASESCAQCGGVEVSAVAVATATNGLTAESHGIKLQLCQFGVPYLLEIVAIRDGNSLELAIGECKGHGLDRLTYVPKANGKLELLIVI